MRERLTRVMVAAIWLALLLMVIAFWVVAAAVTVNAVRGDRIDANPYDHTARMEQ